MKHLILSLTFVAFAAMGSPAFAADSCEKACGKKAKAACVCKADCEKCKGCKDGKEACKCKKGKKHGKKGGKFEKKAE